MALQRRVATYLVVGGLEVGKCPFKITGMPEQPRNVASILDAARELGIRDAQLPMLSRNSAISSSVTLPRPPGRPASILLAAEARRACGRGPLVAGRRRWGQRWDGLPQCRERFRFLGERHTRIA